MPDSNAEKYAQIFEDDKRGAAIFDELVNKFGGEVYVPGGPEGARATDYRAGQLSVLNFILRKINQAHGVNQHETIELDPPTA